MSGGGLCSQTVGIKVMQGVRSGALQSGVGGESAGWGVMKGWGERVSDKKKLIQWMTSDPQASVG